MPESGSPLPTRARPALRWFGFARSGAPDPDDAPAQSDDTIASLAREGRQALLDSISTFLLNNDLAINPANLTLAWNAFSGASPGLLRRIEGRTRAGERITQAWLDEVTASPADEEQDHKALRAMLEELDNGVRTFARSTSAARSATSEYSSELDRQVQEIEQLGDDAAVSRLASLAQAMAARTRLAEAELQSSEREARGLRRRLNKARREAELDHLTGLPNRRAFEAELDRQHADALATGEPLSLAFCDIDHFKRINDVHGHDAGDRVLKLIAQTLAAISDDNCHVSRHGGEEFVLLFRGLTSADAARKLDDARETLAARRLVNRETDAPFGQITFSAGVANVLGHDDPREALKAADGALYRAKEAGRNRVLVA